jgi:hypothetical protein
MKRKYHYDSDYFSLSVCFGDIYEWIFYKLLSTMIGESKTKKKENDPDIKVQSTYIPEGYTELKKI